MTKFKLIVAGSREFKDYDIAKREIINMLRGKYPNDIEIVHGDARGADRLGGTFSFEHNIKETIFPADWEQHGKSAGHIRNQEMADYADACIVFFDKKITSGSNSMVDKAMKNDLDVRIVLNGKRVPIQKFYEIREGF